VKALKYLDEKALEGFKGYRHAVGHKITEEMLEMMPNLRWFQVDGSGVEHLDLGAFEKRGIRLTNAAGINADPMAQQAIASILYFERQFGTALSRKSRREWRQYPAGDLVGKTLGIIGLGSVGIKTARIAHTIGMRVIAIKRDTSVSFPFVEELFTMDSLLHVLSVADYVLVLLPANKNTYQCIGREEFFCMKQSAYFINLSRGQTVDTAAMIEALHKGYIAGAALDVVEPEPLSHTNALWFFDNVLILHHTGGASERYYQLLSELITRNVEKIRKDGYDRLLNQIV
jgi:phosphoglycerate dehydrogenase-like enzyme